MTTLSVSITPSSHGNKVRFRGHILRMFWNEHVQGASEAKQRRRDKADGSGGGGQKEAL